MRLSRKRWFALAEESNYHGEWAARLYLDRDYRLALEAADRAIDILEKLHKKRKEDREVVEVLADDLRNRAEILASLVETSESAARADELIQRGIGDATRAVALFSELSELPNAPYPVRPAEVRLTLSALHSAAGNPAAARGHAELAIADYRRHRVVGDSRNDLDFAFALCRYADVMEAADLPEVALAARREAIELYRPNAGPESWLWKTRHSPGTTWFSTPTMGRYCWAASQLAAQLDPTDVTVAPEALRVLQDVAEGHASLVLDTNSPHPWDVRGTLDTLRQQGERLRPLGEVKLAETYERVADTLPTQAGAGWYDAVTRLRPRLERAATRLAKRNR